jgi:hypothetical protein
MRERERLGYCPAKRGREQECDQIYRHACIRLVTNRGEVGLATTKEISSISIY